MVVNQQNKLVFFINKTVSKNFELGFSIRHFLNHFDSNKKQTAYCSVYTMIFKKNRENRLVKNHRFISLINAF